MSENAMKSVDMDDPVAMAAIVERAQAGDKTALPALQEMLDRVPAIREVLGADLDRIVEDKIATSLGGAKGLAFREAIKRKLAALRHDLEGSASTPTERLLIDRVVACWLQVQEADLRYANAGNCDIRQADFHLRRQNSAHRRYLSALKTLAMIRKLAIPVVQVNIGKNQVNLANASNPDAV